MKMLRLSAVVIIASLGVIVLSIAPHLATQAASNATCTWTGPLDGTPRNWSDAADWSCGAVPGVSDTVSINGGGIIINVDAPVTVQNLTFSFAELRGYQPLTVTGIMTWTSGKIVGGAALSPTGALETLVMAKGANLVLTDGAWERLEHGTLVNYGTVQHGDTGRLYMVQASIDNRAGGTYQATRGGLYEDAVGTAGVFKNSGTLLKQGSGEYRITARLSNAGVINVVTDTLKLEDGVFANPTVTHTGSFSIAPAGTLVFDNLKSNFDATSSISVSGTLRFINGAAGTVRGSYSAPGLTDLSLATLHFERTDGTATLANLNLAGNSRLRGSNDITVTGVMTIAGQTLVEGTSSNTNTLNLAPGATLFVNGGGGLSSRTLNNYGSIVQAASQCFVLSNDAVFNNRSTGMYTVTAGQLGGSSCMTGVTAGQQFNNQGRLIKEGIGEFRIWSGIGLTNSGTLDVRGGRLLFDDAFVQTAGETILSNAGTLGRSNGISGDFVFNGGALRGTGTINFTFPDTVQNNGAVVDPIGLLMINNGGYSQSSTGSLQIDLGGLTPQTQYDVLSVSGHAALNGRLILSTTNGFLPAAGDVFNVLSYGSRSGEFTTIDHSAGLAFGPEYQSGGVVISDNPTLIEFSQKPDRSKATPGDLNGVTLRALNPTTQTITTTLSNVLPVGFRYLSGTLTSNLSVNEPVTSILNDVQTLMWSQSLILQPSGTFTVHFGVAMTTTPNLYVNQAALVLTTATTSRSIASQIPIIVAVTPFTGTQIKVFDNTPFGALSPTAPARIELGGAVYPPLAAGEPYRIVVHRGTSLSRLELDVTTRVLCPVASCGALRRVLFIRGGFIIKIVAMNPPIPPTPPPPLPPVPLPPPGVDDPIIMLPIYGPPPDGEPTGGPAGCATLSGALSIDLDSGDTFYCPPPFILLYLIDPSGYVTDAHTGMPVKDATVTLYRVPAALPDTRTTTRECRTIDTRPGGITGTWDLLPAALPNLGLMEESSFSPPTLDPPINPLRTDDTGYYGWDVIRGCWYVKVEAPGYFTKYSAVVGVPPEVIDLNIALEPWKQVYLPLIVR